MVIRCEDVWQELSNYIDNEVDAPQRASMEEHFAGCRHCSSLLDGTRNVVRLYGDERLFPLPSGYRRRAFKKVSQVIDARPGRFYGWMMALAATGALAGFLLAYQFPRLFLPEQQRQNVQTQPAVTPQAEMVIVAEGKHYHRAGCPDIHGKERLVSVKVATGEGYTPCSRCIKKSGGQ
jgi:anti-sigma factor RsiW